MVRIAIQRRPERRPLCYVSVHPHAAAAFDGCQLHNRSLATRKSCGTRGGLGNGRVAPEAAVSVWIPLYPLLLHTARPRPPPDHGDDWRVLYRGAAQDAADCESTQFISGIEHFDAGRDRLLLAFGVNYCEAKVGVVALRRIVHMLHTMPGEEAEVCLPE
jgi:hypothetical protein